MAKKPYFYIMTPELFDKNRAVFDQIETADSFAREAKLLLLLSGKGIGSITKVGSFGGIPIYLDENMESDKIVMGYDKSKCKKKKSI
jgi:hypothetical protein